jgi:DNA-binding XRE family transcriptional regulator
MKSRTSRSKTNGLNPKQYQQPIEVSPEHKDFFSQVGSRIEELRKKQGVSITELSKKTGISRFTYYLIIQGKVYWNSQTILTLLSHYNIDAAKFFSSLTKSANSM